MPQKGVMNVWTEDSEFHTERVSFICELKTVLSLINHIVHGKPTSSMCMFDHWLSLRSVRLWPVQILPITPSDAEIHVMYQSSIHYKARGTQDRQFAIKVPNMTLKIFVWQDDAHRYSLKISTSIDLNFGINLGDDHCLSVPPSRQIRWHKLLTCNLFSSVSVWIHMLWGHSGIINGGWLCP